jgi:hypothetical protein
MNQLKIAVDNNASEQFPETNSHLRNKPRQITLGHKHHPSFQTSNASASAIILSISASASNASL